MLPYNHQIAPDNAYIAKLAKGASVSFVGSVAGRGLNVLSQVTLARLLGPEAFGLYAIGWTTLLMAGGISPLGLENGVVRYGSSYGHADRARLKGMLLASLGLAVFSGSLMGGGLYFAAPWLAEQVFQKPALVPVLRWFSPALSLYAGVTVMAAATRVSQRMQYGVYTEDVAQPATNLVLMLLFSMLGWGLLGTVQAGTWSFGVAFILALYYVKRLFPEVFSSQVKPIFPVRKLLTFSIATLFAGMFARHTLWIDRLLVGYFLPAAEVGIYHAASQLSALFAVILGVFNAIFSPMVADLYHRNHMQQVDELFKVSTKWGLYLSLPVFLVIILAPREIMTVVFGNGYASGFLPLSILAAAQLINVGTGAVGRLLIMTGNQNRWFWISTATFFTNIALNGLLIPRLGLTGAALSTACAVGGLFFLGLLQVWRSLGVWPYDRRYLKGVLATVLSAGALLLLRFVPIGSPALQLGSMVVTAVIISGTTLIVLGLDSEDREVVRLIRARLGFQNG